MDHGENGMCGPGPGDVRSHSWLCCAPLLSWPRCPEARAQPNARRRQCAYGRQNKSNLALVHSRDQIIKQ